MKVRTQDTPHVIRIPKKIQEDIQEKWFHLYKWISPDEVKLSIERDFLAAIKVIGIPLAVISVLFGLITWLNILVFFFSVFVGVFFLFLYLLILSLRRSFLLTKSAFVIMTDSSISLWWKIHKLSDISGLKEDIEKVSETFEEELFEESRLSHSKQTLTSQVVEQLFGWYKAIFRIWDNARGKDSLQWMLIIMAFYTLYIGLMVSVYFIGVLFLLVLWNLFILANTQYLIKKWHSVIQINQLFWDLDIASEDIKIHKKSLEKLLIEAKENNWKDGLLLAINDGIKEINSHAQSAILSVLELKNSITSSQYKNMFSFEIYNGWIKKQISKPLEDILDLLLQNKEILSQSVQDISIQIKETKEIELKSVLKLQLKRIEAQIQSVQDYIPLLENSISKLK